MPGDQYALCIRHAETPRQISGLTPGSPLMKLPSRPNKESDPRQRRDGQHICDRFDVLHAGEHNSGDQDAAHAAMKGHAAVPDMKDVQPIFGDHVMAVKNAPAQAAADDYADGAVENEIVDVEGFPSGSGPPSAVSGQEPGSHEADKVHEPVPVDTQGAKSKYRSNGHGDGIDVRVGEHARYFSLSLIRQK